MTAPPARDALRPAPDVPVAFRFDRRELAGAVADLGVLVPIAVALVVTNGLSPTAVLLPAGLLYVVSAWRYRVPVPVQPLKAFGAIAIARGLGPDEIAAGALLMGVIFLLLGATGLVDAAARLVPRPLVRGVQLSVGLLFARIAWDLVTEPPVAFRDAGLPAGWLVPATLVVVAVLVAWRRTSVALVLVLGALAVVTVRAGGIGPLGPSPLALPRLTPDVLSTALVVLVLPQLPLTFANSCLATADAARTYFGTAARRVRPGRLAVSLGAADVLAGAISGMPVCHGAGGLTAHRSFGARTGGAPLVLGVVLLGLGLGLGASLAALLAGFPLPVLAGLLAVAGLLHVALLRDLRGPAAWALGLAVGIVGFLGNLAVALLGGLAVYWGARGIARLAGRRRRATMEP